MPAQQIYFQVISMARFCPLFSGSKGNSTYIGSAKGGILIDAGVSAKKLTRALCDINVDISSIGAIFITHEHNDHISGLRVFAGAHGIDVYTSRGTLSELETLGTLTDKFSAHEIEPCGVEINGMFIRPFRTSHDAAESVGYTVITADGKQASVVTDTGLISDEMFAAIYGSDLIMIESNHDVGMLRNCPYPYQTKRRILSDIGHLSNDSCAETITKLSAGGTARFFLAHLSRQNNMPVLAYEATRAAMTCTGAAEGFDYLLNVAPEFGSDEITVF